jgi:Fe-coproporphyrin III synthase
MSIVVSELLLTGIDMVDLIYGRGVTDLIREVSFFASIFKKYISIRLFHSKPAMYGSVDVNNVCNLHCSPTVIGG